jgi:ATP-dependent DNA helicase RecG
MHSIVSFSTPSIAEFMPKHFLQKNELPLLKETLINIHFPNDSIDMKSFNLKVSPYHRRLAFDEFFFLQTGLALLKKGRGTQRGISFQSEGKLVKSLLKQLPFKLTSAQERVYHEIMYDMKKPHPMNRLMQGDVGSGKTIVSLMAVLHAVESGYQSAMMAPTELLAEQHYINVHPLVEKLGLRCELLTGSQREKPINDIESGNVDIVIGTHALIQEHVKFRKLGLIVIDEQHRFGVMQRALLRKKGANPDVLVMTATPIPRTLSLTLYGDVDYSVIDELPPNRKSVITKLFYDSQKNILYNLINAEVKKDRQAYIVYPVIEESDKSNLKSAIAGRGAFERIFPDLKVGLLHGRMNAAEREKLMQAFKNHEIDILVSTTVIEVGVDVPNASLMLIVHAERFGLAQLHQLRGRVGRGQYQSYCFLLAYGRPSDEALRRMEVMVEGSDGFKIAEEDLLIRGPGEFFGTRQSGIPDLRVANLIRDAKILNSARRDSFQLIQNDPDLTEYPLLRNVVEKFWHGKIDIFRTS